MASDGAAGDYFGYAVAIVDNIVVVGAYKDDNDKGAEAGIINTDDVFSCVRLPYWEHRWRVRVYCPGRIFYWSAVGAAL